PPPADGSLQPSAELWNPPGQAGFGPVLGGGFGGLQPHERMGYQLHGAEVNGRLPAVPTFSLAPAATYGSAPSHTPPVSGADGLLGSRGTSAGSSGDALGKALASIYSPDHSSNNFSSSPSTPVGSPQGLAGTSQWTRTGAPGALSPSYDGGRHSLNKVEDRLDEAIHVLRSHAVGTAADGHGLLPGHGALASGFPGPVLPLGGRHASLVGGGHSEDTPTGGGNLAHSHVALPSQPGPLPDLSRPPDSYSGKPPRPGWDGGRGWPAPWGQLCPDVLCEARSAGGVPLNGVRLLENGGRGAESRQAGAGPGVCSLPGPGVGPPPYTASPTPCTGRPFRRPARSACLFLPAGRWSLMSSHSLVGGSRHVHIHIQRQLCAWGSSRRRGVN
uniref:transcription factor E2-alpha-like n=1 Tax=Panthera onca TaxID=9690 RepID=UPI002955B536